MDEVDLVLGCIVEVVIVVSNLVRALLGVGLGQAAGSDVVAQAEAVVVVAVDSAGGVVHIHHSVTSAEIKGSGGGGGVAAGLDG